MDLNIKSVDLLNSEHSITSINLMDEFISNMSNDTSEKQEQLILSVLPDNISVLDIANRCKWITFTSKPNEKTLYLDDEAIITIYDPIIDNDQDKDGGQYMKITQNYKKHIK